MRAAGVAPNAYVYAGVMEACIAAKQPARALELARAAIDARWIRPRLGPRAHVPSLSLAEDLVLAARPVVRVLTPIDLHR